MDTTSLFRISTRWIGWIGLHAVAIAFARSPEIIWRTKSPMEFFEAASLTTPTMRFRSRPCFAAWMRRSVIASGLTRSLQPSLVETSMTGEGGGAGAAGGAGFSPGGGGARRMAWALRSADVRDAEH